ncbi:MAG: hypothetical protein ACI4DS_04025 [Eubacterium sp.]
MRKYLKQALIFMLILMMMAVLPACGKKKDETSDADWPSISQWRSIGLEATLPSPKDAKLRKAEADGSTITIIVKSVEDGTLDSYVENLKNFGFTIKVGSSQNKPFGSVDTYQLSSNSAVSVSVGIATKDNEKIGIKTGDLYIKVSGVATD